MIIANIIGGLGNQMFQYAAARSLAMRKGVPLKLDISEFSSYNLHQGFELARLFNCSVDIAGEEDIRNMLGWHSSARIRNLLTRFNLDVLQSRKFIKEPSFNYWEGINDIIDDCYLKGYWQSEKNFADAADTIRNDFIFRQPFNNKNAELATLISQVNAVSVHVRRGDYISDAKTASAHGVCSVEYYTVAIKYIADRVPSANLFLFSDDIQWVKQNLHLELPCVYVDQNYGADSYNDMRLMSICKHNIIANSSFSWWGAWLNANPDKIIIAPKRWFLNAIDTSDLIPVDWLRL